MLVNIDILSVRFVALPESMWPLGLAPADRVPTLGERTRRTRRTPKPFSAKVWLNIRDSTAERMLRAAAYAGSFQSFAEVMARPLAPLTLTIVEPRLFNVRLLSKLA